MNIQELKKGKGNTQENKKGPAKPLCVREGRKEGKAVPVTMIKPLPSQTLRRTMSELVDSNRMDIAIDVLDRSMRATKKFWSPLTKEWVEEPDFKIQLDAAKVIIAYGDGLPVQRSITVTDSFESLRDALNAAALRSPRAREALAQSFGLRPADEATAIQVVDNGANGEVSL